MQTQFLRSTVHTTRAKVTLNSMPLRHTNFVVCACDFLHQPTVLFRQQSQHFAKYRLRRVRVRLLHQPTVLPSTTIAAFICSIRVFDSHEDRNFQPSPKCDSQIRTNRVSPMTQKHFRQPTHRQTPRKGIRCLKCGSMDHVSIAALDCISLT